MGNCCFHLQWCLVELFSCYFVLFLLTICSTNRAVDSYLQTRLSALWVLRSTSCCLPGMRHAFIVYQWLKPGIFIWENLLRYAPITAQTLKDWNTLHWHAISMVISRYRELLKVALWYIIVHLYSKWFISLCYFVVSSLLSDSGVGWQRWASQVHLPWTQFDWRGSATPVHGASKYMVWFISNKGL